MAGGKSRPKKDKALKVSSGETVNTGQLLARGFNAYKAGQNAKGLDTLYALCPGRVYFTRRKTSHGRQRTFINIAPLAQKA